MKKYRILNLYACLGGNRHKWDEVAIEVGIEINVTAVELDPELAKLYKSRYPNDLVIVADAHKYLLDHYKEYDFVWSSPPCPKNSKARFARKENTTPEYPGLSLYEEIIFLDKWFRGKYCVENVIPYYTPLIPAKKRGRHLFWTNFNLPNILSYRIAPSMESKGAFSKICDFHSINLDGYKGNQRKDKIARNLVDYEAGKTILETVFNLSRSGLNEQIKLNL